MKKIPVETSARHIHLSQASFAYLFGEDATLEVRGPLSQPGQFASTARLTLVGPKRNIERVLILGPLRKEDQVEISLTDARTLGIKVPIRESGDIAGSAPIKLRNEANGKELELKEGLIVAKRHIHMTPADAKTFAVKDKEVVAVKVQSPQERTLIFEDVVVRVRDDFALAMHIDTDESNAGGLEGEVFGELVK
ncbi:MAG: PduL/EutD family phosphate acyltransferase [Bacilli bacterium]